MTKHTTEQDKIEAWMKKKNEWAKQMISAYPEGATFNMIVEKSRQMQSNVARVQRKLKNDQETLPSDCECVTGRAKAISNCCSNHSRHARKFANNHTTSSRTC